jgi:hypothetical protein
MMAEGIEATLARAAQLANMVLSMGCGEWGVSDLEHASVDHECPIDAATDMLVAIIECRKELGISPNVEVVGDITLAIDYWDCECEQDYIHAVVDGDVVQSCNICGSDRADAPNSRLNEVVCADSQIIDRRE